MKTLEHHRDIYIEWLRVKNYAKATIEARTQTLDQFARFLRSRKVEDLRRITTDIMQDYGLWLQTQKFADATRAVRIRSIRGYFRFLQQRDVILVDPCSRLETPKVPRNLPRVILTHDQAKAVLDAPNTQTKKGIRDKAILELFYSTGIRRKEMAKLKIFDVDYKNGFLRINLGKGAKDRVVPIGRKACQYLKEYITQVRAEWSQKNRDERALWLSAIEPHGPINQIIGVMVRECGKAAKLPKRISPHVWRHTCATHLVAGGANIVYAQRLLGHRSITTTERYARVAIPEVTQTFKKRHPRAKQSRKAPDPKKINRKKVNYTFKKP